jgi:hypothetical protein
MSRFHEFCESLRAGKARAEEEQLRREETERILPVAVGELLQRMCDRFGCPRERAHYVDLDTNRVAGTVRGSAPPLRFDPQGGRYHLGLEIGVGEPPGEEQYPLWLRFEFAPRRQGGLECRFGSELFQVPPDEEALCDHVGNVLNEELRQGYTPGPRRIGF